jgi:hypothetical protein
MRIALGLLQPQFASRCVARTAMAPFGPARCFCCCLQRKISHRSTSLEPIHPTSVGLASECGIGLWQFFSVLENSPSAKAVSRIESTLPRAPFGASIDWMRWKRALIVVAAA